MLSYSDTITLDPSQVWVDRDSRQRRQIETEDLEASIPKRGQIQPIVVELSLDPEKPRFKLVAGERRLTACTNLGIQVVAREVKNLSPIEHQLIELEENIKRTDLEWQEVARAIGTVHRINLGLDEDWTMGDTAESIGLTLGQISMYLRVNAEIDSNFRINEANTAREAYNIITRRDSRASASALEDLIAPVVARATVQVEMPDGGRIMAVHGNGAVPGILPPAIPAPMPPAPAIPSGPPPPESTILQADFTQWVPSYAGPKFNFIHCDFPYGIEFASGPQGRGNEETTYDDSKDTYFKLLEKFIEHKEKFIALSAHIMFWYSEQHGPITRLMFADAGFKVLRHPLIWVKSDNAGIATDSRRTPRHVYETALLISRGDRQLVRVKADAYVAPTDKKLHPSTKPQPVLNHFFEMLVDDHTIMLDPTCGSGASIRSAEFHGAQHTLGLEIDPKYVGPARAELRNQRTLKGASRYGL